QPDAQRRDDPPRRRPADAAEVAVTRAAFGTHSVSDAVLVGQSVPSASGSRQTFLRQGGLIAKCASLVVAIGSSGIRWTRLPRVRRSMWGMPAVLPAWLPPETISRWVSGPQPFSGRRPIASVAPLTESRPASEAHPRSGPGRWL